MPATLNCWGEGNLMTKLEPCPFCPDGGKLILIDEKNRVPKGLIPLPPYVVCLKCGANHKLEQWNTRYKLEQKLFLDNNYENLVVGEIYYKTPDGKSVLPAYHGCGNPYGIAVNNTTIQVFSDKSEPKSVIIGDLKEGDIISVSFDAEVIKTVNDDGYIEVSIDTMIGTSLVNQEGLDSHNAKLMKE